MKKSAVSIVKHCENDKSITKPLNKNSTVKLTFSMFDVHFHCFLCLKREKMIPSPDPADSPRSGPRTAARHLPNTRRGQDGGRTEYGGRRTVDDADDDDVDADADADADDDDDDDDAGDGRDEDEDGDDGDDDDDDGDGNGADCDCDGRSREGP